MLAYLPAVRAEFVSWDDPYYVFKNPCVTRADGLLRSWSSHPCVNNPYGVAAWTDKNNPGYFPLTYATFWAEWRLGRGAPWLFHLDNVLLHATNALLVWMVACALGLPMALGWLVAAVWGLHPVHVESVAWITERKNTLSALFYLAALYLFIEGLRTDFHRRRAYLGSLACCAAALLSKATAVTLPAVLLVAAWTAGARRRRAVVAVVPFVVLAIAAGTIMTSSVPPDLPTPAFPTRLTLPPRTLAFYVRKFVWPVELVPLYPMVPLHDLGVRDAAPWVTTLVSLAALFVLGRRLHRVFLFGIGFFLANAALVAGILWFQYFDHAFVADHFAYLPFIGLALALGGALESMAIPRRVLHGGLAAFAATLAVLTFAQVPVWHDSHVLWAFTVDRNPSCYLCQYNLGIVLTERGDVDGAAAHYEKALALQPDPETAINLGRIRAIQDRSEDARALFQRAVDLDPKSASAHYNLGVMLAGQQRWEDAIAHHAAAIRLEPGYYQAHSELGDALLETGRTAEAKREFEVALQLHPGYADAEHGLARVAGASDDWRSAVARLNEALKHAAGPSSARLHRELAAAYEELGQLDDAIVHYRSAHDVDPDDADVVVDLSTALLDRGSVPDAIDTLQKQLTRTPEDASLLGSLAWIRATARDARWRNGGEAIRLAERACALTNYGDPDKLDTLGAAYAEAGRFSDAVRVTRRALDAAGSDRNDIRDRLAAYQKAEAFRSRW